MNDVEERSAMLGQAMGSHHDIIGTEFAHKRADKLGLYLIIDVSRLPNDVASCLIKKKSQIEYLYRNLIEKQNISSAK